MIHCQTQSLPGTELGVVHFKFCTFTERSLHFPLPLNASPILKVVQVQRGLACHVLKVLSTKGFPVDGGETNSKLA